MNLFRSLAVIETNSKISKFFPNLTYFLQFPQPNCFQKSWADMQISKWNRISNFY